jgi:hypothetical protein
MARLKSMLMEIFGLFVDDGSFALAILIWLIVAGWALPHLPLLAAWHAAILFVGLAAIVIESALRRSRRR